MSAKLMSIDTHPVDRLTVDDMGNSIYFVLTEDLFDLPILVAFKESLMAEDPIEQQPWTSQLMVRRKSPGFCTLTLEIYPEDDGRNVLFESIITDPEAISLYDDMCFRGIEIILQGPCFH